MASWEEVKRLAADFQKVQLSSTTQRYQYFFKAIQSYKIFLLGYLKGIVLKLYHG